MGKKQHYFHVICEIHDFGFAVVLPSCPEQYRRVVPSLAHTHRILGKGVNETTGARVNGQIEATL